jgi:hypothetical protein
MKILERIRDPNVFCTLMHKGGYAIQHAWARAQAAPIFFFFLIEGISVKLKQTFFFKIETNNLFVRTTALQKQTTFSAALSPSPLNLPPLSNPPHHRSHSLFRSLTQVLR